MSQDAHLLRAVALAMTAALCNPVLARSHGGVPQSCTCLLISDGHRVFGGGNEDQDAFPARAWFIPASKGKHGRLLVGFEGVAETGMNDQGLFYDSLAVRGTEVAAEEGKDIHRGMWTLHALEACSTVEDVIAFIDGKSIPGEWTDQLFFGDRNGHSIIVEAKRVIRPEGRFQVCTNFSQTRVARSDITCERFLKAGRLLGEMKVVSLDAVRDVLAATAMSASDGSGTAYTTIYDPVDLTATLFFARDYEYPLRFDLKTELARGPHVVELEDMASPSTRRAPWAVEARAELERLIEARIDRTVDRGAAKADLIGHYTIDPSADVVAIPPVMLNSVSVVWDRESPHLVVVPEGISFDLRPAGKDTWFHANVSAKPEIDFVLRRDASGRVVGATVVIAELGKIPFVKAGDVPVHQPLPFASLPAKTTNPSRP